MKVLTGIALASELLRQALTVSRLVSLAQSEGRDLSTSELESLRNVDDNARAALLEAIERAKIEGR